MRRHLMMLLTLALIAGGPAVVSAQQTTPGKPGATTLKTLAGWRNLTWEMTRHNIRLLYAGNIETRSVNELMLHKIKINGFRAQVILKLHALKLMAGMIDVPGLDKASAQELLADFREEFGSPNRARPGVALSRRLAAAPDRMFYAWNLAGGAVVLVWSRQQGAGLLYICTQQWCTDATGPYLRQIVQFRPED
jgi:hypothetical protein